MFTKINYQPKFKKEWSWLDEEGVNSTLSKLFKKYYGIKNIEDKFGLPYTSSSEFAMISNTNCLFEIEKGINLDWFALTNKTNPQIIAGGTDNEENEYLYLITAYIN